VTEKLQSLVGKDRTVDVVVLQCGGVEEKQFVASNKLTITF
jgi:hypothetical protein